MAPRATVSMIMRLSRNLAVLATLPLAACASHGVSANDPSTFALAASVKPLETQDGEAHVVPVEYDSAHKFGFEAGRGLRTMTAGVRILNLPGGGVLAAPQVFSQAPTQTVTVPARMGGGFLFVVGSVVWRSEDWLGPIRPLYTSPLGVTRLFVGLDRAYVKTTSNTHVAFDPKNGAPLDLGPWPPSPFVGGYAAADGWRAVAITDLRGAVVTLDAGSTWRPLVIPAQARDVMLVDGTLVVSAIDAAKAKAFFALQADGNVTKISEPTSDDDPIDEHDDAARILGKRPIVAAVEDGWPLADGTALVARDGTLSRVRLRDGIVVEAVPNAFPLRPAHCHAIPLPRPKDMAAFGFVCGQPRGSTDIYAWDVPSAKMRLIRHFSKPRQVSSPANGNLVVKGACDPDATGDGGTRGHQVYCVGTAGESFTELDVKGDIGAERVVPLADGRTVIVSPPQGDLAGARITVLDKGKATTFPIVFTLRSAGNEDDEDVPDQVAQTLRSGTWLDGFEERAAGALTGWVELGGTYLGIELRTDGHASYGKYIRDLGTTMVSGRYALAFTGARRGYETIDGGRNWQVIDLPDPLDVRHRGAPLARACGPVGCTLAGWARVGWGAGTGPAASVAPPSSPPTPTRPPPALLSLKCEVSVKAKDVAESSAPPAYYSPYYGYRGPTVATQRWEPFFGTAAPKLGTDELGWSTPVGVIADRGNIVPGVQIGTLLRIFAWGPKGIEWDSKGRTAFRFTGPFEASSTIHSTQTIVTPSLISDNTNFITLGQPVRRVGLWSIVAGDDASHVLLLARRDPISGMQLDTAAIELEADRPPFEVHRVDGSTLGEIDAAVRMQGHWYVAATNSSDFSTLILYEIEGGLARELARIPRGAQDGRPAQVRLARREGGRAVGVVVDGQPQAVGAVSTQWVLPVDIDSGNMGEPEPLGAIDLGGKNVGLCTGHDSAWVLDERWPASTITIGIEPAKKDDGAISLHPSTTGFLARLHLTRAGACIERGAFVNTLAEEAFTAKLPKSDAPTIDVAVMGNGGRSLLRCINTRTP
ncbi:hypothetical protein BH09MYX1_BH09MYX1_02480 [soil metagenome]